MGPKVFGCKLPPFGSKLASKRCHFGTKKSRPWCGCLAGTFYPAL